MELRSQNSRIATLDSITDEIRHIFAEVTRYPQEILAVNAHLEEDLGIDSVKLGEILAVIREKFRLPDDIQIGQENLSSISEISRTLTGFLQQDEKSSTVPTLEVSTTSLQELQATVREIFAEVTRYPIEILDPASSLEEDLGIDSVKLGEVLAVLSERFDLPKEMKLPPEHLKSIASITQAISKNKPSHTETYKNEDSKADTQTPLSQPFNSEPDQDLTAAVRQIFADVTRYPVELLTEDAHFEEDLGIDSVKLGEVLSVLREKYHLPEEMNLPPESLQTIAGVVRELRAFMPMTRKADGHKESSIIDVSPISDHERPIPSVSIKGQQLHNISESSAKPLNGKVTFISGSGRGLGKEIAMHLADLGATVIVNSFHSRVKGEETLEEIKAKNGKASHIWGSMANPQQVNQIFDQIEREYGHLDFFISNASNGMLAHLEDITTEHWEKAFRTNIIGLHQGALRALPLMKKKGGGKIITLSSPASHGYVDYFGCMGAVKAAVESLTRSMAIEFAPHNVQVNCVSPGPVYGSLLEKWPESKRLIQQWEDNTAYSRLCEARDVADFVAYLLKDSTKIFTGSVLVMDGGISSQGW